jgi:hypothetical protein
MVDKALKTLPKWDIPAVTNQISAIIRIINKFQNLDTTDSTRTIQGATIL